MPLLYVQPLRQFPEKIVRTDGKTDDEKERKRLRSRSFCKKIYFKDTLLSQIRKLFFQKRKKSFLFVVFRFYSRHAITGRFDGTLQLLFVEQIVGYNDRFALDVRRSHFFHGESFSYNIVHVRFAHAAHHTVDFQSGFFIYSPYAYPILCFGYPNTLIFISYCPQKISPSTRSAILAEVGITANVVPVYTYLITILCPRQIKCETFFIFCVAIFLSSRLSVDKPFFQC